MKPIEGKLFSPFQRTVLKVAVTKGERLQFEYENQLEWTKRDATVNRVRASEGWPVKTFRQLVDEVAAVTLKNKNWEMYYRGQTIDYKNNQALFYKDRKPKSITYPTICRPDTNADGTLKYSIKKTQVARRYEKLTKMTEYVRGKGIYFDEYFYSLFQHYGVIPTPLIDITQSLRVAATFALSKSKTGYVYVFGLPFPNQSISYFLDMGIILIKLQNVVSVRAIRPRYQEGYLVGKFPIKPTKENGDDLANRMIAKFFVDNSDGKFWDKYFQPMPDDILYPKDDQVEMELLKVKADFEKKYHS